MPGCRRTRPTAVFVHSRLRKKTPTEHRPFGIPKQSKVLYHIFRKVSTHILCEHKEASCSRANSRQRADEKNGATFQPSQNALSASDTSKIRRQLSFYYAICLFHNVSMTLFLSFRALAQYKISRFKKRRLRPLNKYYFPLTAFYHLISFLCC